VTFLWRAAGEPEPTNLQTVFTDVKSSEYYAKAVAWAVEKGITAGTTKTTFSPNATVTRAQVVTFLYRYAGKPGHSDTVNPFTDVVYGSGSDWYYDAVLWAVEKGVTQGKTATKFGPGDPCTRGQIVTFLYRDLGDK